MAEILGYEPVHEAGLLALLSAEPQWAAFTSPEVIGRFRQALQTSETYVCRDGGLTCGYLRALVDGFDIYVSELYVAPSHRNRGLGRQLLARLKQAHPGEPVYVLSDEDAYYEKLGVARVGSVYQL